MKYRNEKTGATLEIKGTLSGNGWVPVDEPKKEEKKPATKKKGTDK